MSPIAFLITEGKLDRRPPRIVALAIQRLSLQTRSILTRRTRAAGLRDRIVPHMESTYRCAFRLRRRIISITSSPPAVSQSTVCIIISFMIGGSPFLSLELLHHGE
jgi:hypothetical protein